PEPQPEPTPPEQQPQQPDEDRPPTTPGQGDREAEPTGQESRLVSLVNQERRKNNLQPLSVDSEVTRVARIKAQDMVDNNYFSHYSPTYGSPFDMLDQFGVDYQYAGENLAQNVSVERAHQALMNSSGHRRNILNPNFTHIGVGIKAKGRNGYIYVEMFTGVPH
ncbi:MAG: CAP domain-containing protein, partial [Halothermotrichaceae bacterium]